MFLFGLLVFGLGFVACCSNEDTSGQDETVFAGRIHVFEYDGHEYLIWEDTGKIAVGGAIRVTGITHSGSCKKCKQNGSN